MSPTFTPLTFASDADSAKKSQDNVFEKTNQFLNEIAHNMGPGGAPKFKLEEGDSGILITDRGELLFGPTWLIDNDLSPADRSRFTPLGYFGGATGRFQGYSGNIAMCDDPADFQGHRFGPVGGFPFAGGRGTADIAEGSADIAVTDVKGVLRIGRKVRCVTAGMIPDGATITGLKDSGNNTVSTLGNESDTAGTVTISAPAIGSATGAGLYSIGDPGDQTGVVVSTNVFQLAMVPFIAPYLGTANTPGARKLANSGTINFIAAEMPRDLTGLQDTTQACSIRFNTTKRGRNTGDYIAQMSYDGSIQLGVGAVLQGPGGNGLPRVSIRSHDGFNEKQTISATGSGSVTGGSFKLLHYQDPNVIAVDAYPTAETTAAIDWDATATEVKDALEALPSIGVGNLTATGGPLPGTPVVIEWSGSSVARTNFIRMGTDVSLLTGTGTFGMRSARTVEGQPSNADKVLLQLSTSHAGRTADWFRLLNESNVALLRLLPDGSVVVPGATIGGKVLDVSGGKLRVDAKAIVLTDDTRLTGAAALRRKVLVAQGLKAESTAAESLAAVVTPTSGTLYTSLLKDGLDDGDVITNIIAAIATTGAAGGGSYTLWKFALMKSNKEIVAVTADLSGTIPGSANTGKRPWALTAPYTIPAGSDGAYYACMLIVTAGGATMATLAGRTGLSSPAQAALSTGGLVTGGATTGQTDITVGSSPSNAAATSQIYMAVN